MDILAFFQAASPIGVIGLLAYIIYLLVNNRRGVKAIGNDNHHEVLTALRRIEETLDKMNDNLTWLKAKINGK